MKIILILAVVVVCFSCQQEPKQENRKNVLDIAPSNPLDNHKYMDSLIARAIWHGDTRAYAFAQSHYLLAERNEEFLWTALTFANKYNNSQACFCVYNILNGRRIGEDISNMDPKTKSMAMYYLLKSYELGDNNAKYIVEEIFVDKPIPKSSYYMEEYAKQE